MQSRPGGGAFTGEKNLANLATAIASIPMFPDLSEPLTPEQLATLQQIVKEGKASQYYQLGQTIKVAYGSYIMPFEIVGFEDVVIEGGSTVHAINLLSKYASENTTVWSSSSVGTGYQDSILRRAIDSTYKNKLDTNFVNCLGKTKIQRRTYSGGTETAYYQVFAPSSTQLGVGKSYLTMEGPVFPAFVSAANSARVRSAINDTNTIVEYWTSTTADSDSKTIISTSGSSTDKRITLSAPSLAMVAACNFIGN